MSTKSSEQSSEGDTKTFQEQFLDLEKFFQISESSQVQFSDLEKFFQISESSQVQFSD
ncbi:hypothetical protein T05_9743 [Trichinella murrelli]|uniref:Uncharacterized protein n=1 Tax=Trichinella murrelli TaxID=144512 RepID=A0A0V0SV07_9BILA|nr:hypothetical protein T05_9743 [Trichinella murrelli]